MFAPGPRISVAQLVESHYASLYRYALRLSGSQADAEDLTQETFLRAQNKLRQLRQPEQVRAWLFSILRNAYLQRLRRSDLEASVSLEAIEEPCEPDSEMPGPLPEWDPGQVQKAVSELPEAYRTVLLLYYFEELTYREIAEVLAVPMGTVMSRLARARAYLRGKLTRQLEVSATTAERKGRPGDEL
jgi:RNA polymerase sigma-70 factor (ECF subfamily)